MPELRPDIFIHDERSYRANESLCGEFFDELYLPAFPNENEREPVENIVGRICGRKLPLTEMPLVTDGGRVAAGCVTDHFPDAAAIHVIYLVVRSEYRRMGLARLLLDDWFRRHPEETDMYLEADDPAKTAPADTSFDPATRLGIYARLGFGILSLQYVQPPLEEGLDYERNLLLLYRSTDRAGMKERMKGFSGSSTVTSGTRIRPSYRRCLDRLRPSSFNV